MTDEELKTPEMEDASPRSTGGKGVQFKSRGSIEQVRRISRYSNYDPTEVIAYWGTNDEHRLRKEELREAARDYQMGRRSSDNFSFSTKGISDKVGEGKAVKKENRLKSRMAVMDEQDLQDVEGVRDDELLADIYGVTTYGARAKARNEAEAMAEEVRRLNDGA